MELNKLFANANTQRLRMIDDTLILGKYQNIDFYARTLHSNEYRTLNEIIEYTYYGEDVSGWGVSFYVPEGVGREKLIAVVSDKQFDLELEGYKFYVRLPAAVLYTTYLLPMIYVSIADGPNDSKIPVCWYSEKTMPDTYDVQQVNTTPFLAQPDFRRDIWADIALSLPPVNLDVEPEKRYASLLVGDVLFTYNRNNVSYHGEVSYERKFLPIILSQIVASAPSITKSNVIDYIEGTTQSESVGVTLKESVAPISREMMNDIMPAPVEPKPQPTLEQPMKDDGFEASGIFKDALSAMMGKS